jgi:hypothetical protein
LKQQRRETVRRQRCFLLGHELDRARWRHQGEQADQAERAAPPRGPISG